jgi:RNA recognition motif-containing protein
MLKVHLGSVGEVRVDVAMEGDKSKGYAIAEFATEHAAAVCIRQFNDTEFHGRVLNIREDREADVNQQHSSSGNVVGHTHSERIVSLYTAGSSKRNGNAGCRLFVNNLSWDVAWQDLKDHFKRCGDVIRADVAREEGSNRSRGHGFIEYADSDAADAAIRTLNNSILNGREIFVRKDRDE